MGLKENIKLKKIGKLRSKNDIPGLEKYLHDESWNIRNTVIEVLENSKIPAALYMLIKHYNKLNIHDTFERNRILSALEKIDSPEAYAFIKDVYYKYKDLQNKELSEYAKKVLYKKGNPQLTIDKIREIYTKKLNGYKIKPAEIKTVSNKIKKHIEREDHLFEIISGPYEPEFCSEALKKIKTLEDLPVEKLKKVIGNKCVSKEVLNQIADIGLLAEMITESSESNRWYDVFDNLTDRLRELKVEIHSVKDEVECILCKGKGKTWFEKPRTEDQIYYGEGPEKFKKDCMSCGGSGQLVKTYLNIELQDKKLYLIVLSDENLNIQKISKAK